MAQYPIPQFIEKEGRIISFLTFKQFFWLVGGGIVCAIFYFIFPTFLFIMGSLLIMAAAGVGGFVRVNNMSIVELIYNFIKFSTGAKNYVWSKKESPYPFKINAPPQKIADVPKLPQLTAQPSKLKEIKKLIETKK